MTELSKKVTLTKHSSRIRMALDALREQGLVDEPMDVTPKYKASCVKAHKSLMLH